ncbi:receptor-like protein 51 isoform X2 [Miscanthus floridulus]|uniref:receptor-like protein 51 isoform X2 n=1 Tax=Miscanthus floridulus TaxID=154761 RepID=UPI00345AE08A
MLVNNLSMLDMEEPITVTESDVVDAVEAALQRYSADVTTRAMCLVSLLKLSSRFPPTSESLSNYSLEGYVPDVSGIPQLGYLDLSWNQLRGAIPASQFASNITTIDLSHNYLNGSIPGIFSGLTNLQRFRCTCVAWVPEREGIFVVSHADGNMYVYDKSKDGNTDWTFPTVKDQSQVLISHAKSSKDIWCYIHSLMLMQDAARVEQAGSKI